MVLNESKAEKILGVVFTVLGVLLLAVIIPTQIAYVKNAYPQPRFFPNIIAGLMTVLGIVLFVSGWRKGKAPKQEDEETYSLGKKETPLVLLTLVIVILYVIILHFIPYIPATMVFLAVLITLYGQRNKLKIILPSVLLPIIIYVGFTYGLQLHMP